MKIFVAALAAALLLAIPAHAADVHAVLASPRQRVESADYRATGRLVRVDAAGARTSYGITIKARWFPGVLRVLCEVNSPANARVHLLLELRPNGQNSIRIVHPGDTAPTPLPFDKWGDDLLGSGFSYEDFLEPQYYWQGQAILKRTRFGARDCDVLKSTPGAADHTHYAEVQTWLDHAIGYPVYAEKTQKGTGTVKEFTYIGLRQTGGVWSASQVEVKVRGREDSTFLIVDRGSAKANLSLRDFSPEQVAHF
jgi:hypothetical protein